MWAVLVLAAVATAQTPSPPAEIAVVVPSFDRRWEGEVPPSPWRDGPIDATVAVSDITVDLHTHRLVLRPRGVAANGMRFDARLELDLSGRGWAVVTAELGTESPLSLSDQIEAPRQRVLLEGVVDVALEEGVATVTLVEGPARVGMRVESALSRNLALACSLMLGPGPCASLAARLGRVETDGPPPGSALELPLSLLDPEAARQLGRALR